MLEDFLNAAVLFAVPSLFAAAQAADVHRMYTRNSDIG